MLIKDISILEAVLLNLSYLLLISSVAYLTYKLFDEFIKLSRGLELSLGTLQTIDITGISNITIGSILLLTGLLVGINNSRIIALNHPKN